MWRITTAGLPTTSAIDPSGARLATSANAVSGYLLPDLHANLAAVVNAGETAILNATRYDAFGQTAAAYDSGASFPTPWRFQGRLDVSPDSHPLYDFGARNYDPAIGAFTQLDTYAGAPGDPLSLNRFAYAEANPWTLIDPSGHIALNATSGGGFASDEEALAFSALMYQRTVQKATTILHASDPVVTTHEAGFNVFGFAGDVWNATGGQAVGLVKGVGEGVVGAAVGTAQLGWEGSWWAYHSTLAVVTDRDAFNVQWDTNRAVGGYVWNHPLDAGSMLVSGLVGPTWDKLSHGNVGEAIGELGGQVIFFGGIAKLATAARGAAGVERVAARAEAGMASVTIGELRAGAAADAHHIIQDAAVRNVPGYGSRAAPGISLSGPSTRIGSPHYLATQVQRSALIGGTYAAERQIAAMAMRAAGLSDAQVMRALASADAYFIGQLGLTYGSALRVPGNRLIP